MFRKKYISILAIWLMLLLPLLAQQKIKGIALIQDAIENEDYARADSLMQSGIQSIFFSGALDSLVPYIPLKGKLAYAKAGPQKAIEAVYALIDGIHEKDSSALLMSHAYSEAVEFFGGIGQNKEGFAASAKELEYSNKIAGNNTLARAKCEYNLGVYAQRLGNVSLSAHHHRRSLQMREEANAGAEDRYLSYNAIGGILWYSSKYDSAAYYYDKALAAVKEMPDNAMNKYFRPANIENNLAALYNVEGKTSESIAAMHRVINNFQLFIADKEPHPKKYSASKGLFQAMDNLAGIYKEVGDYGKAGDLLNYSYQQKLQKLEPAEPDIFISEILLGQHYNSINKWDKALQYFKLGLEHLEKAEGDYLFWQADANYGLALVHENLGNVEQARKYYDKCESLYETSYEGEYDNARMDFARNTSLFYAKNAETGKALIIANKLLAYLNSVNEGSSLQAFYQLLNLAEIELIAGRFQQTIGYSQKALHLLDVRIKEGSSVMDSVKMEVFKPKAILLNAKATYSLASKKDAAFLVGLSSRLKNALEIVEKRKVLIDDAESINILIADNKELIEFAKKIELELYELTGHEAYLDQFINLHESGIYNRIRSRLDKEKAVQFSQLPLHIQQEEKRLKAAMPAALQANKPDSILMNDYIAAVQQWQMHLNRVKKTYPAYYQMRYGSIFKTLPQLQSSLPTATTLVRYFYSKGRLLALVADSSHRKFVALDSSGLADNIIELLQEKASDKVQLAILNVLYKKLWAPLAADINTKKVLVVPDGILYNLSFDLLTPAAIKSYKGLAQNSLLARHIITYHYSLFMLDTTSSATSGMDNYAAFAPGFSDNEKQAYVKAINDSVKLDYQYLSLLPQPNTSKLASKLHGMLGGETYLNEESTPASFRENAAGHKIIHIGTHAEYNNQNPERSRLIFAKATNAPLESNSLYLPDIYNCDIRSMLTILTACESGKPGYQDGEGMVSLAHAFNYAGSKSILTGLWKLDEQSSNIITERFVENLMNNMPSDEALHEAKLQYLQQAEGRMQAPAYWAGLILMGKAASIALPKPFNFLPYVAFIVLIVIVIGSAWFLRKKHAA